MPFSVSTEMVDIAGFPQERRAGAVCLCCGGTSRGGLGRTGYMPPFRMLICIASASAYSLTGSPAVAARRTIRMMADVTVKFPGGRSATVPVGSPLSLAAYQAGCQVTYQCKAGTCASCEVLNGMQPVRCCQYKVKKPLLGSTISISSKPGSATRL